MWNKCTTKVSQEPSCTTVEATWNVMAHAQIPEFVFWRNGRVHLNGGEGGHFSRLLAAEGCASAVVMLDAPCSKVVWRVLSLHSPVSPSLPLPCVTVWHHISARVYEHRRKKLRASLGLRLMALLWPNGQYMYMDTAIVTCEETVTVCYVETWGCGPERLYGKRVRAIHFCRQPQEGPEMTPDFHFFRTWYVLASWKLQTAFHVLNLSRRRRCWK